MTTTPTKPKPCPNGCIHTDSEHRAWDLGYKAGARGASRLTCKEATAPLKAAWAWGYDVGLLDCPEEKRREEA